MKKSLLITLWLSLFLFSATADSLFNQEDRDYSIFVEAEAGILKLLHHTLQFGESGTNFDYLLQGGQEILFPYNRYTIGIELFKVHNIRFLYQPLTLETQTRFRENVTIDDQVFTSGTGVAMKYGFPFWRVSYTYDFFEEKEVDLGIGLSLQLRNASIYFESLDGNSLTVNQNLGPVPALNFLGRWSLPGGFYAGFEITGLYASSAFINGASFSFEGSILDASIRGGVELKNSADLFITLRFLGGSAKGTSQYPDLYWSEGLSDYTSNYLATASLTLGATFH